MPSLSTADHRASPPRIHIPRDYNAAHDLIERNLAAGRAGKVAYIDDSGTYTYGELAERVNRCANLLRGLGLRPEERVLLCHLDTIDFPRVFLGAIKAGIVPIAANTLLTTADYDYMLRDSRAPRAGRVGAALSGVRAAARQASAPGARDRLRRDSRLPRRACAVARGADARRRRRRSRPPRRPATTPASGSIRRDRRARPRAPCTMHSSLILTAELYATPILGIREDDVVFSAAKLFFAYGLGNGLTFPLAVGATTVLMAERPTPAAVFARLRKHQPTIFYGVPTLFAALLASPGPAEARRAGAAALHVGRRGAAGRDRPALDRRTSASRSSTASAPRRCCTSSCRIARAPCATGRAACRCRATNCASSATTVQPVAPGQVGELQINGPTAAMAYWNNREKTRDTFRGLVDAKRRQVHRRSRTAITCTAGRSDDMLKVGGIYVSPIEVESALITHPAVLEAAVIGRADDEELVKPMAYVVLKAGAQATRGAGGRAAPARQGAARAVQISALDRVHRRASQDRNR